MLQSEQQRTNQCILVLGDVALFSKVSQGSSQTIAMVQYAFTFVFCFTTQERLILYTEQFSFLFYKTDEKDKNSLSCAAILGVHS